MDRRTYGLHFIVVSVVSLAGLSGCNNTGFSTTELGQKMLDEAANPVPSPTGSPSVCYPASCSAPAAGCRYINQVITNGCLKSCGTLQCDPIPSPTPSPSPSPSPTVTASPSPSPSASPSPSPTVTASPSPSPTATSVAKQDVFNIAASSQPKVDMLFCIDNSGSMADKQTVLANSIDTFIGQFIMRGIDYHIGIVSTDVSSTRDSYWSSKLPGYIQPNRGRLLSKYEKFLTSSSTNVVNKMKANAQVGTSGSGNEQCFNSMLYALDNAMVSSGGFNEGFIRDEALLSMIIVSDENESVGTNNAGETVDSLIARMRSRVSALKGPNSRGYSFDFVINKTATKPSGTITYPLSSGANSYPDFYFKAATSFVSKTYNVLTNFGADLAQIGTDIANQAEKEFRLTALPIAGSLSVKVDGVVIVADPANGYVYHSATNTVELFGTAIPRPGARVSIEYQSLR